VLALSIRSVPSATSKLLVQIPNVGNLGSELADLFPQNP